MSLSKDEAACSGSGSCGEKTATSRSACVEGVPLRKAVFVERPVVEANGGSTQHRHRAAASFRSSVWVERLRVRRLVVERFGSAETALVEVSRGAMAARVEGLPNATSGAIPHAATQHRLAADGLDRGFCDASAWVAHR